MRNDITPLGNSMVVSLKKTYYMIGCMIALSFVDIYPREKKAYVHVSTYT